MELFLKKEGKMITVARMKVAGDEKPLEVYACSEIQDGVSELSYWDANFLRCLSTGFFVKPKISHKDICVNLPQNGTMSVKVGKKTKIFFGKTEELMAIYILANQYQRGENACNYCKRSDCRCQIRAFLDNMYTIVTGVGV